MYLQQIKKIIISTFVMLISCIWMGSGFAVSPTALQLFPLNNYEQNVDYWLNPKSPDYNKPLVDMAYQKKRLQDFYNHTFASGKDGLSPWSQEHVTNLLKSSDLQKDQQDLLMQFDNEAKEPKNIGYGENFRPHNKLWIERIAANINIEQFKNVFQFSANNRAILVHNTYARALPTTDPHFYHHELPGQGYPFDNLQMSAVWAGTPVYIIGQSKDKHWSLVLTPDLIGWIQTESIAKTTDSFIKHWQKAAQRKLAAIIKTETPITDTRNKNYHFKAYVGSVFPVVTTQGSKLLILFPAKDIEGKAQIKRAIVSSEEATQMPFVATPKNFVKLIKTLQQRPYGWGGLYFYNDCSAELKSLYTPFGIWLPRHSADQTKAGKKIDMNKALQQERIQYLANHGRPFMTIVYNTKHVFMYLGNFNNPNAKDNNPIPLTYQNMWALKPADLSRRAVIGQAILFPLLENFKEDPKLNSQANHKDFQIIFLDEWPDPTN